MINAQEWMDKEYPKEARNSIKNLYISEKELEGHLDLSDFSNLEKLDCSFNQLTSINLTGLVNLEWVFCNNNYLNKFDYSSLSVSKLTWLNLSSNNLPKQNLSVFSNLINLRNLRIGNDNGEKIKKGIYNKFYGSLGYLKNLSDLESLYINNTDFDSGVDSLPVNIKKAIYYSTKERPESKIKGIAEELNAFINRESEENWKDIQHDFDDQKQKEWEELDFNYQQTKEWINAGLQTSDYYFASYLRAKGYNSQQNCNWEKLKKENRSAQEWLDKEYPSEIRNWVSWIDISKNGLEGDLVVAEFPNLERLDCWRNQLTSITLDNLSKLNCFDARYNKLSNLNINNNCSEISRLDIRYNLLSKLEFLHSLDSNSLTRLFISGNNFPKEDLSVFGNFRNLRSLYITNNHFFGNLESLRGLKKLERLSVADTEIKDGLEYLSEDLRWVTLTSRDQKKNPNNYKTLGWETDSVSEEGNAFKYYPVPYYDFKYWKEAQPLFKWLEEELKKINPQLNTREVLGNIFFNVKTGDFEGNLHSIVSLLKISKVLLEEREQEIKLLELRIRDLNNQIKEQWQKVHNAYLCCVSDNEGKKILDRLIKKYVEYTKFKKQGFGSDDYRKKLKLYEKYYKEIEGELEEKLEEKKMNEIQCILTECEEIANWQLEKLRLENEFNDKLLQLEEKKQATKLTIGTNLVSLKKRLQNHVEKQKLTELIKEKISEKIKGVEKIEVFPTWFNDICAIVIGKEKNYNLWIVTFKPLSDRTEEKVNYLKVAKLPPIREKWEEIIEHFKKALNSDYPAAETLNNIYTFELPSLVKDYGNVEKTKMKVSPQDNNFDDYLKPYDIVKANRKGGLYQHVAIYLGNKRVAHVRKDDGEGARIGTWEEFLRGDKELIKGKVEIEICHPFIPFKSSELIQEHISIAVAAKYGKGKYNLFKENCEHFAMLCVYGLGISPQSKFTSPNTISKDSDYLLQAIEASNIFFRKLERKLKDELVDEEEIKELINKFLYTQEWHGDEKQLVEFVEIPTNK